MIKERIKEIESGVYDEVLENLYLDKQLVEPQKSRYIKALQTFEELYGDKDISILSVPGRSEVSGNHTDHQNGKVLATSINLDMIGIISPSDTIKIVSDDYDLKEIQLDNLNKKEDETGTSEGIVRGVVSKFKEEGYQIGGFTAYITSDVVQGSGLSSSAAFESMIGAILSYLYNNFKVPPVTISKIGQYSENVYFGKPCGLMDQCACSVGGLITIDFKNEPDVRKVNVDFSQFGYSLCIVDVKASHADLTDDYASVPREMKEVAQYFGKDVLREVDEQDFYKELPNIRKNVSDRSLLRGIHLFNENKRVEKAVNALEEKDFPTFLQMIKDSGDSSYKYLQNVYSNHYVDNQAVSLALALSEQILGDNGVCRVHGGGFAGTIQAFVKDEYVETYKKEIEYYFGEDSCHILKIRPVGLTRVL